MRQSQSRTASPGGGWRHRPQGDEALGRGGPPTRPNHAKRFAIVRVSRTIADLHDRAEVDESAIAEACCFSCDDLLRDPH